MSPNHLHLEWAASRATTLTSAIAVVITSLPGLSNSTNLIPRRQQYILLTGSHSTSPNHLRLECNYVDLSNSRGPYLARHSLTIGILQYGGWPASRATTSTSAIAMVTTWLIVQSSPLRRPQQ
ncbi:hypothetical protein CPB83DRAFT_891819 [Crepidotus variabilis]|uniref:Uncharacterized protein n=1 Tax=Crepidotus variabilis TaxID=179855 RepID=A0A9P6JT04_9AGAR|nr:hypothetical protein CPB83DRAFT_891819 [Crepidotus variabilis]